MTLYPGGQVVLNSPIKGVTSPRPRYPDKENRLVRGLTYRTQDQIEEWLNDLRILQTNESYVDANYWAS